LYLIDLFGSGITRKLKYKEAVGAGTLHICVRV